MTQLYDGDLTIGKAAAGARSYVTENTLHTEDGTPYVEVLLGPLDPPTWDTATVWGRGPDDETAWRYALAAVLEPDTDPVTPAPVTI